MIRQEQCNKVCRILDDVLANRPTERDSLIVAVRKAFEALEAHEEQQWIPVEERLPEPWDFVLVTDRCKDVRVCQMHHNSSDGWYDECDNWMYFSTSVIAWMPLPEPYQEGEQE
jgi:hypothetical protein